SRSRLPPRSPLFPYATLFRSAERVSRGCGAVLRVAAPRAESLNVSATAAVPCFDHGRSAVFRTAAPRVNGVQQSTLVVVAKRAAGGASLRSSSSHDPVIVAADVGAAASN